jgi:hypothetical protein
MSKMPCVDTKFYAKLTLVEGGSQSSLSCGLLLMCSYYTSLKLPAKLADLYDL